ncbi:hypothetical protein MNBD_PLANCTO02-3414 [hydrothermal vent metagenome]|uniref:Dienelactone hydrolase domain-containing protein n=1 Tax=hydrothermal vent metagenome TaxID=652676 RepID=A0A3B1D9W4_9ZZZZ
MNQSMMLCLLLVSFCCWGMVHSSAAYGEEKPTNQKEENLDVTIKVQMKYLLTLPKNYEKQEKWPLVLFLHGAGERGDNLDLVKIHGPPMLVSKGENFPFILVSPQCRENVWWQSVELTALLDEIEKKYHVDKDRIYVTGLSMGGFGSWALAAYTPDRFAAIVPICGGGETYKVKRFSHVPVWAFHGAKDRGVPLERSQEMVDEMIRQKGNAKLTIYPNAGHNSWTKTYDNPKLYEWLLQQKRHPRNKETKEKK